MGSTHLSLHYHIVFSTKDRHPSLGSHMRERVHAYIGGIVHQRGGVALEIGGVADHVHALLGLKAIHRLSDLVRDMKGDSSRWVHDELGMPKFAWQDGYSAFTVSTSLIAKVRAYIRNQETHHRKRSFVHEYRELLERHEIKFDERFLL